MTNSDLVQPRTDCGTTHTAAPKTGTIQAFNPGRAASASRSDVQAHPARICSSIYQCYHRIVAFFLGVITRAPDSQRRGSPCAVGRPRILFYSKYAPYYGFANFSDHPVIYDGKEYPTSEHLFQSFKFQKHRPNLAEHIRTCSKRPSVAFSEARRFQPEVRRDWEQINVSEMDKTLWHKFTQHADLAAELLGTGEAELVEDSDKDGFWGIGADGQGRNELGKALERMRANLKLRKAR